MPAPPAIGPAIVLARSDYGERDRIVRLLSPELGVVAALARNARGSRRRFGAALDPGTQVSAHLRRGRGSLWHLERAEVLDGRMGARTDLVRLTLLAWCCEIALRLAPEEQPEPRLYGLLDMACLLLDAVTEAPASAWRAAYAAKALTFVGLAPVLDRCRICGLPPDGELRFDPVAGGAAHSHCEGSAGLPVSVEWLAAAEAARRTPLRDLVDTELPPGPPHALTACIEAHLGRPLQAGLVLAQVEGPG